MPVNLDHLLYLAEGNSETPNSWSGSSRSLVRAIRESGTSVRTADVLPGFIGKCISIALTFHPTRDKWAARYHSGQVGFRLRSWKAAREISHHPAGAPVLQAGATFIASDLRGHPLFVYCDANAIFAARGESYSSVSALRPDALADVIAIERRVYSQASGIFTFSEVLRRSFIEDFGIPSERVRTVFGGSNLPLTPGDEVLAPKPDRPPTILFVGKAFERKGGPDLLAAFKLVRAAIPDAKLIIAGTSPSVVDDGVEVVGFVDPTRTGPGSLSELYSRADIFCMPSRYEPFGVVFVEAMLHGLPCIGANAWAMPEIITPGATGWLAPLNDPAALARVLIEALADRGRLRQMGARARGDALERFTWSHVADAVMAGIRDLTPGTAAPLRKP